MGSPHKRLTFKDVLQILDLFSSHDDMASYAKHLKYGNISYELRILIERLGQDWILLYQENKELREK